MAKADIEVALTEELKQALAETREELHAAKEALSEKRIRAIVREELSALFERMRLESRLNGGTRV